MSVWIKFLGVSWFQSCSLSRSSSYSGSSLIGCYNLKSAIFINCGIRVSVLGSLKFQRWMQDMKGQGRRSHLHIFILPFRLFPAMGICFFIMTGFQPAKKTTLNFADNTEVFQSEYSQHAILRSAHFWRVVIKSASAETDHFHCLEAPGSPRLQAMGFPGLPGSKNDQFLS